VNTIQKVALALVGAAVFYTAVAPESQTVRLSDSIFRGYNSLLKTVTGQA
jgi:hypothetical protein